LKQFFDESKRQGVEAIEALMSDEVAPHISNSDSLM